MNTEKDASIRIIRGLLDEVKRCLGSDIEHVISSPVTKAGEDPTPQDVWNINLRRRGGSYSVNVGWSLTDGYLICQIVDGVDSWNPYKGQRVHTRPRAVALIREFFERP